MSLQTKLLAGILPVVFLAMVSIALLTTHFSSQSLLNQIAQNTVIMNEGFADELNTQLLKHKRIAQSLAVDIPDSLDVNEEFRIELQLFPEYRNIFYTSPQGTITNMAPLDEAIAGRDFSEDPAWRSALETGQPAISTVHERYGYPAVSIAAPIIYTPDALPEVQGIVVLVLSTEDLFAKVNSVKIGETGGVIILDRQLRILNRDRRSLLEVVDLSTLDSQHTVNALMQGARQRQSGWGVVRWMDEPYYVAFAPVPSADWTLMTRGRLDEVTTDIDQLVAMMLSLVLVALLLTSLIIYFSVLGVTRPIRQLTAVVQDIEAEGFEQKKVEITSRDEVAQLSRAFDQMTGRIGHLVEQLRYRLGFEELVLGLSTDFLRTHHEESLDAWLATVLEQCAGFTKVDRAYLRIFDPEDPDLHQRCFRWDKTCGVSRVEPHEGPLEEQSNWLRERLEAGETVHIRNPESVPDTAPDLRKRLEVEHLNAILILPLRFGGRLRGYLELESMEGTHPFSEDDITLLQLMEEIIAAVLGRFEIEEELRLYRDELERLVEERTARIGAINAELRREIEDRELAERAQGESEVRYRTLIEQSVEAIYLIDADTGKIVEHNQAFLDILGYDAEDALDLGGRDFIVAPEEKLDAFVKSITNDGFAPPTEFTWRTKHDAIREVQLTARAIKQYEKELIFIVARDITEQKLLQSRLVLADRLASLGTLAAGVAHEINNPLAFVISNLDFLKQELAEPGATLHDAQSGEELLYIIERTSEGAERMRRIVRDLREFAYAGDETVVDVDPRTVLDSALSLAASEIRHAATIERHFEAVPTIKADTTRLGQVFLNLLVNASQSFPPGRRAEQNKVVVHTTTSPDGRALIEVTDNGVGIAPENLDRIFDPFYTTKQVGVGIGLGLFICHNIVASMGGEIEVESTLGEGTTFRLYLP